MSSLILTELFGVPNPSTTRGQSTKLSLAADGSAVSYAAGKVAVIRSLSSATPSRVFGNPHTVTVAILSPHGLLAMGDERGAVKVLDYAGEETRTKLEVQLGGAVRDIAFDGEGTRVALVGEGKQSFGSVYSLSTGSAIGEISGSSRALSGVAMRKQRPFRMVTGSEDASVVFLQGPPFKFASLSRNHSRSVNSVDYSPDGTLACSAGDKLHLYDGIDGSLKRSFSAVHTGSIYAAIFSPDSKLIATSSADCTTKIIDAETGAVIKSWTFAHQQVGNIWNKEQVISLSSTGDLSVLDPASDAPLRVLYGHQKPVTVLTPAPSGEEFFTGDAEGRLCSWSAGVCTPLKAGHSSLVISAAHEADQLVTIGMDDVLRITSGDGTSQTLPTGSLPKAQCVASGHAFLATAQDIQIINLANLSPSFTLPVSYSPTSIAISSAGTLAVGAQDGKVHLYSHNGASMTLTGTADKSRTAVTALAFSPSNEFLAVGEQSGKIIVYDAVSLDIKTTRFVNHSARIASLAFHQDNIRLVSGSLDASVLVFSLATPSKVLSAKNSHGGGVCSVFWQGDAIVSAGSDGTLKSWKLPI